MSYNRLYLQETVYGMAKKSNLTEAEMEEIKDFIREASTWELAEVLSEAKPEKKIIDYFPGVRDMRTGYNSIKDSGEKVKQRAEKDPINVTPEFMGRHSKRTALATMRMAKGAGKMGLTAAGVAGAGIAARKLYIAKQAKKYGCSQYSGAERITCIKAAKAKINNEQELREAAWNVIEESEGLHWTEKVKMNQFVQEASAQELMGFLQELKHH